MYAGGECIIAVF